MPVVDKGSTTRGLHAAARDVEQVLGLFAVQLTTSVADAAAAAPVFTAQRVEALLAAAMVHDALLDAARSIPQVWRRRRKRVFFDFVAILIECSQAVEKHVVVVVVVVAVVVATAVVVVIVGDDAAAAYDAAADVINHLIVVVVVGGGGR